MGARSTPGGKNLLTYGGGSPATPTLEEDKRPVSTVPGWDYVPAQDEFGNWKNPRTGTSYWQLVQVESPGGAGAASLKNAELDYQLGLKSLEVDWANVGVNREQVAVSRAAQAEEARFNKAQEAMTARQRALDAASEAMQAYLTGSQLADARRLSAFQESRELLPYLVSPNQKYQAGMEPGGTLAAAAARYGLPFNPQELPKKQLTPSALAIAPTNQQIGPGIMTQMQNITAAGNAPA